MKQAGCVSKPKIIAADACVTCYRRPRVKGFSNCARCRYNNKRNRERKRRTGKCMMCSADAEKGRRLCLHHAREDGRRRALYGRKLKVACFEAYGGARCRCCGETIIEFLTIDHVDGGGREHRRKIGNGRSMYQHLRKLGYPAGFQVLCYNCNCAKGFYGVCPHEEARQKAAGVLTTLRYVDRPTPECARAADRRKTKHLQHDKTTKGTKAAVDA